VATLTLVVGVMVGLVPASAASWDLKVTNGIYSWWGHEQSVRDGDVTWTGSIARKGTVRVHRVATDGSVREARLGVLRPNDHTTPAIALHPDRPDMQVFWTGHGTTRHVSVRSLDRETMQLGPERQLSFGGWATTYTQVATHGHRIYLLTRANGDWMYTVSEDWGATWDEPRLLFDNRSYGTRVYVQLRAHPLTPGRAQLATYGHPTISTPYRHADYAEIDLATGEVVSSFVAEEPGPEPGVAAASPDGVYGNLLDGDVGPALAPGTLPHAISASGSFRIRMLDVGTWDGRPAIAYAVWPGETGPARYKVKVLRESGEWTTSHVDVPSGIPFGYEPATKYLGGMAFDNAGGLVMSRESSGRWYLERHAADGTRKRLGGGGTAPLARPYVPRGTAAGTFVVQKLNRYDSYTRYDSDLLLYGALRRP
jgi:hypothetical protein